MSNDFTILNSSGTIDLDQLQDEFKGTYPSKLSEYYGVDSGVPVSGKISLSNFYGKSSNYIAGVRAAWGAGFYGQLGLNGNDFYSYPVPADGLSETWKQLSGGSSGNSAGGIKTDGTLWMWGYNPNGELGTNNTTNYSSPVQTAAGGTTWRQLSVGSGHAAATKTDGTLWVWGNNYYGQLGRTTASSSPVQTDAGGTNWKQVSSGAYQTAAIKTDGTLWVWGYNFQGQLGTNNTTNYSSPVQTAAGGTSWKQVSCGGLSTAAIKTDGTLWTWGNNSSGELGTNDRTYYSSPITTVAGGTNWKQVSMGSAAWVAVKTDGSLWSCGYNGRGGLGDGTYVSKSSPITEISGGLNWKQVSTSGSHSAGLKSDGTLWLWGKNLAGELGIGSTQNQTSPMQPISGSITGWSFVSCGADEATFAITSGPIILIPG